MRTLVLTALVALALAPAPSAQLVPDDSFGSVLVGSGASYSSRDLAIDLKDRPVSLFGSFAAHPHLNVTRFDPDGTRDALFGTQQISPGRYGSVRILALSDGGLLAFGRTGLNGPFEADQVWTERISEQGSTLDPIRAYPSDYAEAIAAVELPDGLTLVVRSGAPESQCALMRLDADGDHVESFGTKGFAPLLGGLACAEAHLIAGANGTLLVAATVGDEDIGQESNTDIAVTRYFADGTLDASFGLGGVTRVDFEEGSERVGSFSPAQDGSLLVAGPADKGELPGKLLLRLTPDGDRLSSFGADGLVFLAGPDASAFGGTTAAFIEPDGRITVHGVLATPGSPSLPASATARLLTSGLLDMTYGDGGYDWFREIPGGPNGPYPESHIARDSEGRTIIAFSSGPSGSRGVWLARYIDGGATSAEATLPTPPRFQIAPNPARRAAVIKVAMPIAAHLSVSIFDALGRRVASLVDGPHPAGPHALTLDATSLPPGTYLVRMVADELVLTQRLAVVR